MTLSTPPDHDALDAIARQEQRAKQLSPELYAAIVEAERAAQHAHNLAYKEHQGYWLRTRLGKAQSILIHYVVKYAGGSA